MMDKQRATETYNNLLAVIADPITAPQSRERAEAKADALKKQWGL